MTRTIPSFAEEGLKRFLHGMDRRITDLERGGDWRFDVEYEPEASSLIPGGGSATLVTPGIPVRAATSTGELFFDETFSIPWDGSGSVLLSSTTSGNGNLYVDDRVRLNVTHQDGSTATFEHTFPSVGPALDVTAAFESGVNSVRVRFDDVFGTDVEATAVWFVVRQSTSSGSVGDSWFLELDDLADVDTTTVTPQTGDSLVFDGLRWVPATTEADVEVAGRWEVVVAGVPADPVTTPDGTDWLYAWVSGEPAAPAAPTLASKTAIAFGSTGDYAGNPIVTNTDSTWKHRIREPGQVIFDPVTDQYVVAYSGINAAETEIRVGVAYSDDGLTGWTEDAGNPISGSVDAEDPYLAKTITGNVYRDPDGRALMFCEERTGGTHRGIILFRSTAGTLDGWTHYGRVLDKAVSGWDSTDRTSPTVIFDGDQLVMLYEGRGPSQEGQIGRAVGSLDGITWTADADPIIVQGAGGTWNDVSVVPDDLVKIGSTWVLLVHGNDGGATWLVGRYSTTDDPTAWGATSFTEMVGNPYSTITDAAMCWGNDPTRLVHTNGIGHSTRYDIVDIVDA